MNKNQKRSCVEEGQERGLTRSPMPIEVVLKIVASNPKGSWDSLFGRQGGGGSAADRPKGKEHRNSRRKGSGRKT